MLRCIIGEDRSGVQALASACEGISGVHNVGDIFNPSPKSRIHEFYQSKSYKIAMLRDGTQAFHVYREFFENVVEKWNKEAYSNRGLLFTIKYETILYSPGLSHYLDSAGVRFIHLVRRDIFLLVSSILDCQKWTPLGSADDDVVIKRLLEKILCRKAYFAQLQCTRGWPVLANEDVFESPIVRHADVLRIFGGFFGVNQSIISSPRPGPRWPVVGGVPSWLP